MPFKRIIIFSIIEITVCLLSSNTLSEGRSEKSNNKKKKATEYLVDTTTGKDRFFR